MPMRLQYINIQCISYRLFQTIRPYTWNDNFPGSKYFWRQILNVKHKEQEPQ